VDDPARDRALSTSPTIEPAPLEQGGLDATIVLVRHGESQFIVEGRFQGQADSPLSPMGLRQAERVAARLAHPHASPALPVPAGPPIEIVHSPLARAAETAEEIGRALAGELAFGREVPLRAEPGISELAQGEWEGLHRSEIERRWPDVLAMWRRRPLEVWAPGGESIADASARVRPALTGLYERLAEHGTPGTFDRPQVAGYLDPSDPSPWSVVVGHDGLFKVLLLTMFELPLDRFWMWSFDLCGIAVIEFRAGRPVVRAMNLSGHLAPLLDEAAQEASEARQRSGAL
jgi:phosphoserine phosphatase